MASNNFSISLKSARLKKGLSLQNVSDLLNNSVSKQSIYKYEKGLSSPKEDIKKSLESILDFEELDYKESTFSHKTIYKNTSKRSLIYKISSKVHGELDLILKGNYNLFIRIIQFKSAIKNFTNTINAANKIKENINGANNPFIHSFNFFLNECGIYITTSNLISKAISIIVNDIPVIIIPDNVTNLKKRKIMCEHFFYIINYFLDLKTKIKKQDIINFMLPQNILFDFLGEKREKTSINELIILKNLTGVSIIDILFSIKKNKISTQTEYNINLNNKIDYDNKDFPISESPFLLKKTLSFFINEQIYSLENLANILSISTQELYKKIETTSFFI